MYVFDSLGYLFLEVELPGHMATPLDLFRTAKLLSEASVPRHTSTCLWINSHSFQNRLHDYQEVRETENFVSFDLAFEAALLQPRFGSDSEPSCFGFPSAGNVGCTTKCAETCF